MIDSSLWDLVKISSSSCFPHLHLYDPFLMWMNLVVCLRVSLLNTKAALEEEIFSLEEVIAEKDKIIEEEQSKFSLAEKEIHVLSRALDTKAQDLGVAGDIKVSLWINSIPF